MIETGDWPSVTEILAALPGGLRDVLTGGITEAGRYGAPTAVTGQRAVVVPIVVDGRKVAARFWLADPAGSRWRIDAVARAVDDDPSLPLLRPEWIADAIEVGGRTYPGMLTDWVDGRPLQDAVDELVEQADRAGLRSLAERCRAAFIALDRAGVVHGDLQHGNVLVASTGDVVLVDYDSVWVRGNPVGGLEHGHPNYRHPAAAALPAGRPSGDSFPALVIVGALTWLAEDPGLWKHHHGENLILDAADLAVPETAGIWTELDALQGRESRDLEHRLLLALASDPERLGGVEEALSGEPVASDTTLIQEVPEDTVRRTEQATGTAAPLLHDAPPPATGADRPTLGAAGAPVTTPPPEDVPLPPTVPVAAVPPNHRPRTSPTGVMHAPPVQAGPGTASPLGAPRQSPGRATVVLLGTVAVLAVVVVALVAVMIGQLTQPDDESGVGARDAQSVAEGDVDDVASPAVESPSTSASTAAPTTTPTAPSTAVTAPPPTFVSARVARTCGRNGRGDCFLSVRSGPTSSSAEMYRLDEGTSVSVQCQVDGESVTSSVLGSPTTVWARGTDGNYMSAAFLEGTGFNPFAVTTPC
jgi:hypothetical protein